MNPYPKPAANITIWGIVMFLVGGPVITAIALPISLTTYSGAGAIPWVLIGIAAMIAGLIMLLVGMHRIISRGDRRDSRHPGYWTPQNYLPSQESPAGHPEAL